MDFTEKGAIGCLVLVLFSVLALVVAIAVGVFFGAWFGLLTYAGFVVFALIVSIITFKQAK